MKKFSLVFFILLFMFQLFADEDNDKLKLAVMEFEDRSGNLSERTLSDATEYIRGAFVNTNKYVVIAKERQEKAMIKEMKKESYKACNDKNCQIPLGQALSADTILRTTITFFGGSYTITSELIDLAKEATVIGAKEDYDGSETALKTALDKIVAKIAGYVEKHNDEIGRTQETEKTRKEEPVKESKQMEEKQESEGNTYHPYKIAGISLIAAGAAVAVAGIAGFHVASDKEFNKYKNMRDSGAAQNAVSEGLTYDQYMDKARKHKNKSNTYRILEITSGAVGGAALVTGIVLTVIKKEKTDERVSLKNISFSPSNDGFYAAVGFEF